ncbi:MAG: S1-like domain-containing RNA-binding protein [Bacteroidota bacterium]
MILGEENVLEVLRIASVGLYLGDEEGNDVLLPNQYLKENYSLGDKIPVFVYRDSEDRIICTTEKPLIYLNQFRYLKVKEVGPFGAFLDWGLRLGKDLFVPFKEQQKKMEADRYYLVTLRLDDATNRLMASNKINRYLDLCEDQEYLGKEVEILIGDSTDLGITVIVEDRFRGIIYHNDVNRTIQRGQLTTAFVSNVRPDGKLDLRFEETSLQRFDSAESNLLSLLEENKVLYLSDKSDPDDIRDQLSMSKKMFKQSIGKLYKAKRINIFEDRIELIETE